MANVPAPGFVDVMRARQPEVGDAVAQLFAAAFAPGELPLKIKLLIALGIDAAGRHPNGCLHIADMARAAGATERELDETLGVIAALCGTGGLATASGVFHEMRGAGFGSL